MPDIAMCLNTKCKMKDDCYRYSAIPSKYQSYAKFKPQSDTDCENFMPIYANPEKTI